MKFNYGLIAVLKSEPWPKPVLHFCGYEELPSGEDEKQKQNLINHLIEELSIDEEFGLTCKIDECDINEASQDVLDHYNKEYELHEQGLQQIENKWRTNEY